MPTALLSIRQDLFPARKSSACNLLFYIQYGSIMKNWILLLLLWAGSSLNGKAQDVYNMVLESATRIVNSPTSGYTQTQIAQFKRTALVYMKQQAFKKSSTVSADFLNTQAYFLSEYITLFFDEILKSKKLASEKRKERILLFMDASVSNPLFNDPDHETTLSFINDGGEITPFSLDTDWQKAYAAVKDNLK